MHDNVWDEIIYKFPNFNGGSVEARQWIKNISPHTLVAPECSSKLRLKWNKVSKTGPWFNEYGAQRNAPTGGHRVTAVSLDNMADDSFPGVNRRFSQ